MRTSGVTDVVVGPHLDDHRRLALPGVERVR